MRVEERLKKNFLRLKDVKDNNHERTKEVLANMDREADDIKTTVMQATYIYDLLSIHLEIFLSFYFYSKSNYFCN